MQKYNHEYVKKQLINGVKILDLSQMSMDKDDLLKLYNEITKYRYINKIIWGKTPRLANFIIKQIEEQLAKNNNYLFYPNDFIHLLLNIHANIQENIQDNIQESTEQKSEYFPIFFDDEKHQKYNEHLQNWNICKIFYDPKVNYLGIIYINNTTHNLVLVHCNLDIQNYLTSKKLLQNLRNNSKVHKTQSYKAINFAADFALNNNYNLSITGHSFSAWLCEISADYCQKKFPNLPIKIINFDSPGTLGYLKKHDDINITTYLSEPNLINCSNTQIGNIYQLFPKNISAHSVITGLIWLKKIPLFLRKFQREDFIVKNLLSLSIQNLERIAECFNLKTQKPENVTEIISWPVVEYTKEQGIFSFLSEIPIRISKIFYHKIKYEPASCNYNAAVNKIADMIDHLIDGAIDLSQEFSDYQQLKNKELTIYSYLKGFSIKYKNTYKTK